MKRKGKRKTQRKGKKRTENKRKGKTSQVKLGALARPLGEPVKTPKANFGSSSGRANAPSLN